MSLRLRGHVGARRGGSCCTAASYRVPWAELLRKVFAIDVLACPECEGRLEMIAFISQGIARKI